MANTKITSNVIDSGAVNTTHIASGAISAAHLTGITTANITENTNLYYTDSRARSSISVTGGNLAYDSSTGVLQLTDGEIRDAFTTGGLLTVAGSAGVPSISFAGDTNTGIYSPAADNLGFSIAGTSRAFMSASQFNVSAKIVATELDINGNGDISGNFIVGGDLRGPASFVIDPAAHGDDTGTVVIAGNLQVDGTTTTINSTTVNIDDLNIQLATGANNAAAATGAGITIDCGSDTDATLTYNGSNDAWSFNKNLGLNYNNPQDNIHVLGTSGSPNVGITLQSHDTADATATISLLARNSSNVNQTVNIQNTKGDLYIDSDVGIGTAAPDTLLELRKDTASSGYGVYPALSIRNDNATGFGAIHFQEGSTQRARIEVGNNSGSPYLGLHTGSSTNGIRIDSSGKVGIGETIPLGTLHVKSTDSGATADGSADDLVVENNSNTGISILSGTASTGSIYFGDSDRNWDGYIAYSHGSSPTMTIASNGGGNYIKLDDTGHVGISTTPTAWGSGYKSLQIGGRGFVGAHSGSDLYVGQNAYHNSGWKYEDSVAASLTQHSGGQITHFVAAAGTAGNAITWTRAIHVKVDGKVGFGGSSNPSYPVEINSDTGAGGLQLVGRSADNVSSLGFSNNAKSVSSYIQSDSSWIRVRADGGFHFKRGGTPSTASSNAFTITDANLVVTADSYLNGDLKVGTDSSDPGAIYITDDSTTAYTLGIIGTGTRQFEFRGSSSGADYHTSFTNPSSGGHNLTVNGVFTVASGSNSAILINGNAGGLSFTGGNNRIYFNSARALEGNGTTLQVGEGHTTGLYQMATNTFYGNVNPSSDDTYDLGTSSQRWRNVYTGDLHLSNEGKEEGNEVDGTTGNWTIQEGEEHLFIINNKSGKKYRFALEEIE